MNLKNIQDLLHKADPVRLIKYGAPQDEYDVEASELFSELNKLNSPSIEDIQSTVYHIFYKYFCVYTTLDDSEIESTLDECVIGTYDSYYDLAKEIWATLNKDCTNDSRPKE